MTTTTPKKTDCCDSRVLTRSKVVTISMMLRVYTSRLNFFFFNDTATTEIYTLSLHDALPIWRQRLAQDAAACHDRFPERHGMLDRKSTRLNSSHTVISYAVFCLKKKIFTIAIIRESGTSIRRSAACSIRSTTSSWWRPAC